MHEGLKIKRRLIRHFRDILVFTIWSPWEGCLLKISSTVPAISVAPSSLSNNCWSGTPFSSFLSLLTFTSKHQSATLFFRNIINIIFSSFLHFVPAGLGTLSLLH